MWLDPLQVFVADDSADYTFMHDAAELHTLVQTQDDPGVKEAVMNRKTLRGMNVRAVSLLDVREWWQACTLLWSSATSHCRRPVLRDPMGSSNTLCYHKMPLKFTRDPKIPEFFCLFLCAQGKGVHWPHTQTVTRTVADGTETYTDKDGNSHTKTHFSTVQPHATLNRQYVARPVVSLLRDWSA